MKGAVSIRLSAKKEAVLSLWEKRCVSEVPSAKTAESLALRNSIPIYLDHLSEALATNRRMDFRSVFAREEESGRIGRLHGSDRASNRSYILTEVIFEYHILREVLFQMLEEDGPLENVERDIIFDSIEQAVNDAAVEFSEVHADIQQKFINTLTHDLKNPIAAAKSFADLILRKPDTSEDSKKSTRRIVGSLNRLTAMIHDLLDASRIRAGEPLSIKAVSGDLDVLVREIVDEMSLIYGERFFVDSAGSVVGNWDFDALRRAIENLVVNAIKYGAPEKPILIILKRSEQMVELTVHNEGPAIPEKEIPILFKQYKRAQSAHEGTQTGWGLGLTLVKGVMDAHHGKVRVSSSEGKGTDFVLEIPASGLPIA